MVGGACRQIHQGQDDIGQRALRAYRTGAGQVRQGQSKLTESQLADVCNGI